MPLYHTLVVARTKVPTETLAASLRKAAHHVFDNGGWVRACENHGVRQLPYRIRAPTAPESERYQLDARFVSLSYDAPVATKQAIELQFRLDDNILRFNSMRQKSVVDEVLSLKTNNPWNVAAGVQLDKRPPKRGKKAFMDPGTIDLDDLDD